MKTLATWMKASAVIMACLRTPMRRFAACKAMVDDELNTMWKPGTTANELYELYIAFGPDPFVVPLNPKDPEVEFSAWTYAKEQCQELVSLRRQPLLWPNLHTVE